MKKVIYSQASYAVSFSDLKNLNIQIAETQGDIVKRRWASSFAAISKIHSFKEIRFKTFESLFHSCVTPVLDYCSGVWEFEKFSCVDNVQNRALRYFLGLHRFTPHLAFSGEVGWLPSTERRWLNMFRLWNRLIRMEDSRLTKKGFYWDYSMQGV